MAGGDFGGGVTASGGSEGVARAEGCPERVVEVVDSTGRLDEQAVGWLTECLVRALAELGAEGEVRARVVDDAEMARAHRRYAGVEGTTDVLTFDLADSPGRLDVDLLVCLDEGERRARELGHGRERELLLYMLHGVLHCMGFDDADEASACRMHAEEDRVLARIGVGATFAPGEGA